MSNLRTDLQENVEPQAKAETVEPTEQPSWETPKMEDVSEQVMAQPYIRFT